MVGAALVCLLYGFLAGGVGFLIMYTTGVLW